MRSAVTYSGAERRRWAQQKRYQRSANLVSLSKRGLLAGTEGGIVGATGGPIEGAPGRAMSGAGVGAGAGVGFGVVGSGIKKIADKALDAIWPSGLPGKYTQEAIKESGLPPEYIRNKLSKGTSEVMGDMNPELQAMLTRATQSPGRGAASARHMLAQRTHNQYKRLDEFAKAKISPHSGEQISTDLAQRQKQASDMYA